jgi:hypothetical protein
MAISGHDRDRRMGIGVAAFFGLCLGIAVWVLLARRRARASLAARSVEIVGGVPFRVRASRAVALSATVSGVMAVVAWGASGSPMAVLAGATAALTAALVPVILFGPPSRRAVVFEPEGLRLVEPSYEVVVPWNGIAGAWIVDVHDTLLVALALRDPAQLVPRPTVRGGDPAAALGRLSRRVSSNRAVLRCDLCAAPAALGLDPVLFLRAVETYVSDPEARPGLARRALGTGSA